MAEKEEADISKEARRMRRLPKMSFNSKDLSRRMKRVEGVSARHARRFVLKRLDNFKIVRRQIAFWVLLVGVLIGAAGLQFWWYQRSYTTNAHTTDGTYAEALLGPVDTLNPLFAQSSAEEAASKLLFARLLGYDQTGAISFDLAESMKVSDDGKEYILSIRPDAQWSDGIYIRARDVVYTVNLIKNPATRSTLIGWDGVLVAAVNETTVKFTLPSAYAAFPHALQALPIIPEHILRDVEPASLRENGFSAKPVGSGPFELRLLQVVDAAEERKVVHLGRNAQYHLGSPRLSRVQLHVYKDAEAIKRALATSEVNAVNDLTVLQAKEAASKRHTLAMIPVNSGVYALFNTSSPVLSDTAVRKALQVGTDTSAVRESIASGLPSLHLPFVDGQVAGEMPSAPAYSKKEAEKLLADAGWVMDGTIRKKNGVALEISAVTMKNSDHEQALKTLAAQWKDLGVAVKTEVVDPKDVTQNVTQNILQPRRYDVLIYQLSIGGDPDVYAYWHSSGADDGYNFSKYKSGVSDDALISARTSMNAELRKVKYATFAKQWIKDVPAIGLYQGTVQYVHSPSVHIDAAAMKLNTPSDRYDSVRYWYIGEHRVYTTP